MKIVLVAGAILALTAPAAFAQTAVKPTTPAAAPATQQMQRFLVFFDWDKATLTPDGARVVKEAAEVYKKGGSARITVTGHTDTSGSASYNQGLSERRAATVKQELIRLGVAATNITAIGKGQTQLLVPTKDGVREAQNRRVEIDIPRPPAPPPPAPPAAPPPPPPPPPVYKSSVFFGGWYGYSLRETDRNSDLTATMPGISLGYIYNVTPHTPLRVELDGYNTFSSSQDDGYGGRASVGGGYKIDAGAVSFTPGLHAGYISGKGVQDGPLSGPTLMIEGDITERMYLYGKAEYDILFLCNSLGNGVVNGGVGLGYCF